MYLDRDGAAEGWLRGSALLGVSAIIGASVTGCRDAPSPPLTLAEQVRETYLGEALDAFAAWEITLPAGQFVAMGVRSLPPEDPRLRIDFWFDDDEGEPIRYSRSETFLDGNELDVTVFDDLTGDQLPELAAEVLDTLAGARSILLLGAQGSVDDVLAHEDAGWHLSVGAANPPRRGECWLEVWALEPIPDSLAPGWRYLPITPRGLGGLLSTPPTCGVFPDD